MRCAICDSDSDTVTTTTDCSTCNEAVQECLDGYPKVEGYEDPDDVYVILEEDPQETPTTGYHYA